jgi:hypothetical protein
MMGMGGRNRRLRVLAVAAAGVALLGIRPEAAAQDPPGLAYEFDAPLAPVCIDGTFPLTIDLPSIDVEGTLNATTDAKGKVTGTFTSGVMTMQATGKVKYRSTGNTLNLKLQSTGQKVTLKGTLVGTDFSGTTSGKGSLAPGKNTFVLDLSTALPSVARISVLLPDTGEANVEGAGQALVCGDPLEVTAKRKEKKVRSLLVKTKGFKFSGAGPIDPDPNTITATWSASGFGAKAAGVNLDLVVVLPPAGLAYGMPAVSYVAEEAVAPNSPMVGGGPARSWTVDPPLPGGLVLNPLTGVITGAAAEPSAATDYTVTVANLAGSTDAVVNITVTQNPGYDFSAVTRPLTDDDLRHFLMRTHFGIKQSEFDTLKSMGLDAYLDQILDFQSGTQVEADAFEFLKNPSDPPGLEGGFPNDTQIARWWIYMMLHNPNPFQEKLALFWHDRIPTASPDLGAGRKHFFIDYANIFRHRGQGNFKSMMVEVSRDPSMLTYLNGDLSNAVFPDENYAREFWELFTLGVDNGYTQADIVEAAKAFTGWRRRFDQAQHYMEFDPTRHVAGPKTIFGVTIPGQNTHDDFQEVADITFAERNVAEFITARIFEEFCFEGPNASIVADMAQMLRDGNYELKPFLKALFLSEAFFSAKGKADMVKTPLEYTIGFFRTTGLHVPFFNVEIEITRLAHRPAHPPSVNGWPTGTLWFSAASMVVRANLMTYVQGQAGNQRGMGIVIEDILPPVGERTDEAVVDTLSGLLRLTLTPAERQGFIDRLNIDVQANGTVVPSPFDGSNTGHLDARARAVLNIMTQHPTYQVK